MFKSSTNGDVPQKPSFQLLIKQEDKFFSRLLSKESSATNPSFRVYCEGVPGSVPFIWESRPGTPKHAFADTCMPPLTPPPRYYFESNHKSSSTTKKSTRSSLLHILSLKTSVKKSNNMSFSSSSCSNSSMSSSSFSSTSDSSKLDGLLNIKQSRNRAGKRLSCRGSSFDSSDDDLIGSPRSTLCFGSFRRWGNSGLSVCYGR